MGQHQVALAYFDFLVSKTGERDEFRITHTSFSIQISISSL
jgi:hypothetical protein